MLILCCFKCVKIIYLIAQGCLDFLELVSFDEWRLVDFDIIIILCGNFFSLLMAWYG